MVNSTFYEISTAANILATARNLMDMESAAQRAAREKDLSILDEFVRGRAPTVLTHEAGILKRLGEDAKQRIRTISSLSLSDDELFRALFGLDLPPGAGITKKPYVIQCSLCNVDYERTCLVVGMKPSYANSEGLYLSPDDIRPKMRKSLGNAITLVKMTYEPVIDMSRYIERLDTNFSITDVEGNFYTRTPSGLKRHPVSFVEQTDPLTGRHEEIHEYQRLLANVSYIPDTETLERDLFEEEAAECIAEAEKGVKQKRTRLVHTAYFDEHDLPESRENLHKLAEKMNPKKPDVAKGLVSQRDRNEYALFKVYESADAEFKKLAGWALHLVDFYRAHRIIPAMQAVYETM